MIAALTFGKEEARAGGRAIRPIGFELRSTLPLSAACLVANGVREQLSRLLATELDVDLIEPAIPGAEERRVLVAEATIFRVRGRLGDAFVIVRPADARSLVSMAFNETERSDRDSLSDIEAATLDRIVGNLVPLCNALCGSLGPVSREGPERAGCDLRAYFEVRTTGQHRVSIGFALTYDPAEAVAERLTLEDLADVEVDGVVQFARGSLGVPAFSRLTPGTTVVLDSALDAPGVLRFGDVEFARGTCGIARGRSAFSIDAGAARAAA